MSSASDGWGTCENQSRYTKKKRGKLQKIEAIRKMENKRKIPFFLRKKRLILKYKQNERLLGKISDLKLRLYMVKKNQNKKKTGLARWLSRWRHFPCKSVVPSSLSKTQWKLERSDTVKVFSDFYIHICTHITHTHTHSCIHQYYFLRIRKKWSLFQRQRKKGFRSPQRRIPESTGEKTAMCCLE